MSSTSTPSSTPTRMFIGIGCGLTAVIATTTVTLLGIFIIKSGRFIPLQATPKADGITEPSQVSSDPGTEGSSSKITGSQFTLPSTGVWSMTCQHTHDTVMDEYGDVIWELSINWERRSFESIIDAGNTITEENSTETFTWHEEATGYITEDGYLWGDATQTNTSTMQYWQNDPNTTKHVYETNWLGAISEDINRVCLFRVGGLQIDLDWIRERGRQEMLDDPGGLCEGLCIVK